MKQEEKPEKEGTLHFNLSSVSGENEFKRAINATNAYIVLHEVINEIFRPVRKHGFNDEYLNDLINAMPDYPDYESDQKYNAAVLLLGYLENKYYDIMERYNINLNDLE